MSMEMKDSGIEWIGEIPENWKVKRLKNILCERKEINKPIKSNQILSLTNDRGVILYTEKGDVGNKSKDDLTAYKLAYVGDIVLNSMNVVIGSVALSSYCGCVSPVYYMLYKRNQQDSINYYNYLFQTKELQNKLKGYGNGIMEIRMRISMSKLNTVELPIAPSNIQQTIAAYLDKKCGEIDEMITLQEKIIEELKLYKKSVITEVVTKGLNPNSRMKDSGFEWIGEIPEHWKVLELRYIGKCQNGISKSGEFFGTGHPFVSYSDVYNNYELPKTGSGLIESTKSEQDNYSVKRGDIFFTRTSETIEEVGLTSVCLNTIENATFAGFLIRVRPFFEELAPTYSKYYFRSEHHRMFIVKEMNLVIRASLGQGLLKKLPVLLPPLYEQEQIANYLDQKCAEIDKLANIKQQKIDQLKEYKKSIIYEYVTGKKQVKI